MAGTVDDEPQLATKMSAVAHRIRIRETNVNRFLKRQALALLAFAVGMPFPSLSTAAAQPVVHFAGFAYAGPYSGIAAAFPYTSSLAPPTGSSGESQLDERLRRVLSREVIPGFKLDFTTLGNVNKGDSLALALVLDHESVSVEQIQHNVYKLLVTLDAQALFFNANKMQIIASYPFGLDYIDTSPMPPTKNYITSVVKQIYLGGLQANLFAQFADKLSKVNLKPRYGNTIQITDVEISSQATDLMPAAMQQNMAAAKALFATQFAAYLSNNADVPVLPYTKGYAIGNKIVASFANGKVFNLAIPTPDYAISLGIKGFKKILYSQNAGGASWIYGAFASVEVSEPLSHHIYINLNAKNGAVKIVPATQVNVADWPAYQDTLFGLMDQVTAEFTTPDKSWIKIHTGDSANIIEFQNVTRVLKSCQ